MGFQFLPKSVTLDDTEGPVYSCFENTCIFRVHHELKWRCPHYHRQKCRRSDSRPI